MMCQLPKTRRLLQHLTAAALLLVLGSSCSAVSSEARAKVPSQGALGRCVLVTINNIGWDDVNQRDCPNIWRLANEGAAGLMNTRTGSDWEQPTAAYVTLGAGSRCVTGEDGVYCVDGFEQMAHLYQYLTGRSVTRSAVACLDISELIASNAELRYSAVPGALGDCLALNRIGAGVVGNADFFDIWTDHYSRLRFGREIAAVAMDSTGIVPWGTVEMSHNRRSEAPVTPENARTDFGEILSLWSLLPARIRFVAIETGDTARVDHFVERTAPLQLASKRRWALRRADHFVSALAKRLSPDRDLLLLVTPFPSSSRLKSRDTLTPIVAWGKGFTKGLLISTTTRWAGVVCNTDVAPTILAFFGIATPFTMTGRPMTSVHRVLLGSVPSSAFLGSVNARIVASDRERAYLARPLAVLAIVSFLLSGLILVVGQNLSPLRPLATFLLAVTVASPAAFLLLPMLDLSSARFGVPLGWILAILLSLLLLAVSRKDFVFVAGGLAGFLILGDQLTGATLARTSPLSYSAAEGARFYGLGNEYMGVLMGGILMALGLMVERWKRPAARVFATVTLVAALLVIGHPSLGAKVGGVLSAGIAFLVLLIHLYLGRWKWSHVAWMFMAVFAVVLFFAGADLTFNAGSETHLGRFTQVFSEGGVTAIADLATRKLSMAWRLLVYSTWSRTYWVGLGMLILLSILPASPLRSLLAARPYVNGALVASAIGSVAILPFNDAGALAAALCIIYPTATALAMVSTHLSGH